MTQIRKKDLTAVKSFKSLLGVKLRSNSEPFSPVKNGARVKRKLKEPACTDRPALVSCRKNS